MKTIFVYGTLKSNKSRNFYITHGGGKLLGKVKTAPKYSLVKPWFADYPALVEDEDGISVEGELWDIPDELIATLDNIEGKSFKRTLIELSSGSKVEGYLAIKKPFLYWNQKDGIY